MVPLPVNSTNESCTNLMEDRSYTFNADSSPSSLLGNPHGISLRNAMMEAFHATTLTSSSSSPSFSATTIPDRIHSRPCHRSKKRSRAADTAKLLAVLSEALALLDDDKDDNDHGNMDEHVGWSYFLKIRSGEIKEKKCHFFVRPPLTSKMDLLFMCSISNCKNIDSFIHIYMMDRESHSSLPRQRECWTIFLSLHNKFITIYKKDPYRETKLSYFPTSFLKLNSSIDHDLYSMHGMLCCTLTHVQKVKKSHVVQKRSAMVCIPHRHEKPQTTQRERREREKREKEWE